MLSKKLIACFIVLSLNTYAEEKKVKEECQSTKEFITTLNYLKNKKEYGIEEKKSIEISSFVASGCNGAANRFIQTMNFLTDAEVPTNLALVNAKNVALENDQVYNNFVTIFKKIYVEKYFDLTAAKSLKMASELTVKMDKEPSKVLEDFNTLGDFCMGRNGVDLGYEKCSEFIFKTLIKSKDLNVSIGKQAIEFFDFLTKEEKGPKLTVANALLEIEKVVEFGPNGMTNYRDGFSFALNNQGLNYGNIEAMKFAYDMAYKSFKK
jgi:hypothetical protein